jgi:hypothetical protein
MQKGIVAHATHYSIFLVGTGGFASFTLAEGMHSPKAGTGVSRGGVEQPVQGASLQRGLAARDYFLLSAIAVALACAAFIFYFRHGAILLNGDSVAHINIARHIVDSRTPGILEFGTVWLPLPHLITTPFVMNDWMWRTGVGGSIPSMIAYVFGVLGIFRLVRGAVAYNGRKAAWIAALAYGLNPNLLYMQATAMTESLYLALFIWAVVWFCEFVRDAPTDPQRARKSLELSSIMISAAMLVRYDGWFLAACATIALLVVMWRFKLRDPAIRRGFINFVLLMLLIAGLWLAYNYGAYGSPLEFATGPYSAHAISDRARTPTFLSYPGENSPRTAALYFLKLVRVNLASGFMDSWLLGIAFAALVAVIYFSRRHLPLALLWIPVIFYVANIASANVQIYFPDWWPYTYYNTRYGLQMLPAIAIFAALAYSFLSFIGARGTSALILLLFATGYFSVWRSQPICLREAEANGRARFTFDAKLATELKKLPSSATLMMYCGWDPGALQGAGIPFHRVVREGNHPEWDIGLSQPAKTAEYVIAIEGDEVYYAVRLFPQHLSLVATVETPGRPRAFIYRSLR